MSHSPIPDLELIRQASTVNGTRVRFLPDLDTAQAEELIRRGLAELAEDWDDFVPGTAHQSLRATQYGFDLVLGRIAP